MFDTEETLDVRPCAPGCACGHCRPAVLPLRSAAHDPLREVLAHLAARIDTALALDGARPFGPHGFRAVLRSMRLAIADALAQ